jgi:hypothetical protein
MSWTRSAHGRGEMRCAYKILIVEPGGKRPLGMPWRRWKVRIKMYLTASGGRMCTGFIWLMIGTGGGHW